MFTNNFETDYLAIEGALRGGKAFALSRFGDGEWSLLKGLPYKSASGWVAKGEVPLRGALLESLQDNMGGYCVGISAMCCHPRCAGFFSENFSVPKLRRTFSTVFFHGNFLRAKAYMSALDAFTVGCTAGSDVRVPSDAVNNRFDIDDVVQQMLEVRDRPILVAAGPAACVIVHRYWRWTKRNPENRVACIDVGALLDEKKHGKQTRYYHDAASGLHRHYCKWVTDNTVQGQPGTVFVRDGVRKLKQDRAAFKPKKSPLDRIAERLGRDVRPKWVKGRSK